MVLFVTRNSVATTGVLGFILTLALPTAWPLPCGWLVTSASTLSNGRVERLFTVTTTWTECRPFVALELSCRICWASGDGDPGLGELAVVGFSRTPQRQSRKCRRDQDRDSPQARGAPGSVGAARL